MSKPVARSPRLLERARRIVSSGSFRNASFSGLDHALLPVLLLAATPVFVARLGIDRFGIWMLVNSLLGFSGLFSFGLSDATIKYVSHYRAVNDEPGAARVIRSTLTVYLILGAVVGVLVTLTAPLMAGPVFKVEPGDGALLVVCLRICGLGIVVRMFESVLQSALQGFERYDFAAIISMATNVSTVALNLALVLLGYGLDVLLAQSVITLLASALVKAAVIKFRLLPGFRLHPSWDWPTLREIFGFGVFSWVHGMSGMLVGQADRLLIASMLGTRSLAYYSVCLQIAQQIHALPAKACACLFPLTSAAAAVGDVVRLRQIYFGSSFLVTVAGVALGFPIFMMAPGLLTLWMGTDFAANAAPILRILAFNFSLMAYTIVPYYYAVGTGRVRLATVVGLVGGLAVISTTAVLIPRMGVTGAAWARLATLPPNLVALMVIQYCVLDDRRWFACLTAFGPVLCTYGLGLALLPWSLTTVFRPDLLVASALAWSVAGLVASGVLSYANLPARGDEGTVAVEACGGNPPGCPGGALPAGAGDGR